ncbi:unnamed protein product [Blepharisma stoltei]|uniref:Uncharacterized protein n=1 Tax=Blepharisma stoltei TaxID=1481888 RepID=A0AAU9K7J3_9CILI|nr:unnamed protein product [Blepharisma stoltei]
MNIFLAFQILLALAHHTNSQNLPVNDKCYAKFTYDANPMSLLSGIATPDRSSPSTQIAERRYFMQELSCNPNSLEFCYKNPELKFSCIGQFSCDTDLNNVQSEEAQSEATASNCMNFCCYFCKNLESEPNCLKRCTEKFCLIINLEEAKESSWEYFSTVFQCIFIFVLFFSFFMSIQKQLKNRRFFPDPKGSLLEDHKKFEI